MRVHCIFLVFSISQYGSASATCALVALAVITNYKHTTQ